MREFFSLKKGLLSIFVILCGVFLLSTSFERTSTHPLQSIPAEMLPSFSLKDAKVLVLGKVMTDNESKRNFGHDLLTRGIKPLHLTIQNNTSSSYSICQSSVDLESVNVSKVTSCITRSSLARSIGYKIAGFFFWPMMIPGTIDGIRNMTHRKNLKKDIAAKSLKQEVVAPYATYNRVLFVKDDQYDETFHITLIDLETLEPLEFKIISDK